MYRHPEQPGLHYLYFKEANSSLLLLQAFKENIADIPGFSHQNYSPDDVLAMREGAKTRLRKITQSADTPLSVLSAESISTFTLGELETMRDFFQASFDKLEVVIYVRPLKERMESAFQEILKTRYRSLAERFPLNYMRLAMNFDEVFRRENVHFYSFSRRAFPGGSIVAHFLEQIGVPPPIGEDVTDNSRLSKEAVQLLYVYRQFFPHERRGDDRIVNALSTFGDTPFHFHSSLFQALLHTGKNSSERFAERAGFSVEVDIQKHDNIGIRCEEDLLNIPQMTIDWLHNKLTFRGKLRFRQSSRPEKIAQALRLLAKPY